jgi:hypothetical protein
MNKTFTWTLPDEPYKNTTLQGNTIDITYTGPKYVLVQVDRDDHECHFMGGSDNINDTVLDHSGYAQDDYDYVILDASVQTMEAAYITEMYTHADPEDYTETFTDADGEEHTYEHIVDGTSNIMQHHTWSNSVKYNADSKIWSGPEFRTHANDRATTMQAFSDQAQGLQDMLDDPEMDIPEDARAKLAEIRDYCADIERKFAGIDHWKIPFDFEFPAF